MSKERPKGELKLENLKTEQAELTSEEAEAVQVGAAVFQPLTPAGSAPRAGGEMRFIHAEKNQDIEVE
jgi:hypothetical protein